MLYHMAVDTEALRDQALELPQASQLVCYEDPTRAQLNSIFFFSTSMYLTTF